MNCSEKLDWEEETAPIITDYMKRMSKAGYGERYREGVLRQALAIYDKKWKDHHEGSRPIFRPKEYEKEKRRKEKEEKRYDWAKKGGCLAPIFVPATPDSRLLKMMRKAAEEVEKKGIKFNMVEMGGRTVKSELQRSNPTATPGCTKDDCACCVDERGKGGQCHRNNVNYKVICKLCPNGEESLYIGETARNLYTRMNEHLNNKGEGSFITKHMNECHGGKERKFLAQITKTNKDCLSRQVREGVHIQRYGFQKRLLNTRSEWHQPSLYRIQSEIVRE